MATSPNLLPVLFYAIMYEYTLIGVIGSGDVTSCPDILWNNSSALCEEPYDINIQHDKGNF
ncbi:hypothetical protein K503DRAFT_772887 [Rhizopogon vinicolor AM-OR11-026]|uniref:Uncharacterized protein n=1 Tax=Rhizopogon vinicolor AM-OR11-026 TaxID=1314800 RepID=A0A1B7MTX7_9AGAM|nr:hypothetical protein K503DRAFT_772887 [Rhizopogon vinicolor AM-OR11-026]